MPYFRSVLILVVTSLFLMASTASAYVIISTNDGIPFNTSMIIDSNTSGAEMEGMLVTAYFDETLTHYEETSWIKVGQYSGKAVGNEDKWGLKFDGTSTDDYEWNFFTELNIYKLRIDAIFGNTVFDVVDDVEGSLGSKFGKAFSVSDPSFDLTITASYTNLVTINNDFNSKDLYSTLEISFKNDDGATVPFLTDIGELSFFADTDTINPVPEPGTLLLLGAGLLGLSAAVRRR